MLLQLGGSSERLGLPCLLGNPMAMPLLVLDLPLLHRQLLLHLGFGLRLGHGSDIGVAVGAVGALGDTSMASTVGSTAVSSIGAGEGFQSGLAKVCGLLREGEWSLHHCWVHAI
jgi:hypothetical protein